MTPEERLGIQPMWVAHALEIRYERPVTFSEGEYICRTCGDLIEGCRCDSDSE